MGQVTIYLDAETERRAKRAASSEGISLSRWICGAIEARTRTEWPPAVAGLAGAWPDFPDLLQLRRQAGDAKRVKW